MSITTSVHWNLHKLCWSVTERGKVRHTDRVTISNPRTFVGEGKYQESQTKGKRVVCAWIKGQLEISGPDSEIVGRPFSYNPMKSHDFYYLDTDEPLMGTFTQAEFWIDQNGKPQTSIT